MQVMFATYSAVVITPDGGVHPVTRGSYWFAGDAVVTAAPPDLFSAEPQVNDICGSAPPPGLADPPVERVTAAPGETRARVRRG